MEPAELLAHAEELLRTGRAEEALHTSKKAFTRLRSNAVRPTRASLPALNLLGEIYLELGEADSAREHFLEAVKLDPDGAVPDTEGGGPEKFLWLAQLSEEGGRDSVDWFGRGATVLRNQIAAIGDGGPGEEKRKKLSEALCGIIEVYMTDLSWESDAEARCESLISEALLVAPHSPEPLQTLASIRVSQTRIPEAKKALADSISLWKDLPPEDTSVPDFPTRISLARLLMEVELEEEALEVVERLVSEDDQSVESWYLGGWCLYLLGEKRRGGHRPENVDADAIMHDGEQEKEGQETQHVAALVSSREWLRQSLTLFELLEYEDERLRDHAKELVERLDTAICCHDVDDIEENDAVGEGENSDDDDDDEDEDQEMDEV